jgi:hypothetical protein
MHLTEGTPAIDDIARVTRASQAEPIRIDVPRGWTKNRSGGLWRSSEERQAAEQVKTAFHSLLPQLSTSDPAEARAAMSALRQQTDSAAINAKERNELKARWARVRNEAFRRAAEDALEDDLLTIQEELAFDELAAAMEIDKPTFHSGFRELNFRVAVARANDGRLYEIENPRLITKADEVVHFEMYASLMKEVAIREYQGGYGGVSFRIANGVRYSTGRTRGRSVVIGTEWQVADSGVLSVSSTRAVFLGSTKSIEFQYAKLMGMDVYSDGIRLSVSNRQTTPLFQLESGDAVAATINAAMQRLEERPSRSKRKAPSEDGS